MEENEHPANTLLVFDRVREVNYNGAELWMNTYGCTACNKTYYFEHREQKHCPFCGVEFSGVEDVSA